MDYRERFFENLSNMFKKIDHSFPDVSLFCIDDGTKWPCHRVILSASSIYFRNLFNWTTQDVIEVHNGVSGETIDYILKFIYTGEISVTSDNVVDVLAAANYFQLVEVIELCSIYILDNLEFNSSLTLLTLTWQLSLTKTYSEILRFVAQNFSDFFANMDLNQQLLLIPFPLMIKIVKSDHLTLRNSDTLLLTRPADREKLILNFILSYLDRSKDDTVNVSLLLSCVRWPLLNIFGEEDFVFNTFTPRLDNGTRREEINELFDIKHTEGFKGNAMTCSESDLTLYVTRAFSCSELVPLHPLAGRTQVIVGMLGGLMNRCDVCADPNDHIIAMEIIISVWNSLTFVAGMTLTFSKSGSRHAGQIKEHAFEVHTINLDTDEHIISVNGSCSWLVDSLKFKTNKRSLGPYGGQGGVAVDYMSEIDKYREEGGYHDCVNFDWHDSTVSGPHQRSYLDSILVGFTAKEYNLGSVLPLGSKTTLVQFSFIFREMLPSSTCTYLISKERMYEVPVGETKRISQYRMVMDGLTGNLEDISL